MRPLSMIVCSLALSGCVAAPLAQMAVSQMPAPKPACSGCATDTTLVSISQGVSDSFHRLTGPQTPPAVAVMSPK